MGAITLQNTYSQLPSVALVGTVRLGPSEVGTTKNTNAAASIPIGAPVAYKPAGATSDMDVTTPANATDVVMGIVMHSDDYSLQIIDKDGTRGELDATGIVVGALMDTLMEGWIYVTTVQAVKPGDRLFVSYAVGGLYTAAGQFGNATQAATTIDCTTKGEWKSTALAGGKAWLKVDFLNK